MSTGIFGDDIAVDSGGASRFINTTLLALVLEMDIEELQNNNPALETVAAAVAAAPSLPVHEEMDDISSSFVFLLIEDEEIIEVINEEH